jgi:hypothetical protein
VSTKIVIIGVIRIAREPHHISGPVEEKAGCVAIGKSRRQDPEHCGVGCEGQGISGANFKQFMSNGIISCATPEQETML